MKTFTAKPQAVEHQWFIIDANNLVLGRLASEIARRLREGRKCNACNYGSYKRGGHCWRDL